MVPCTIQFNGPIMEHENALFWNLLPLVGLILAITAFFYNGFVLEPKREQRRKRRGFEGN